MQIGYILVGEVGWGVKLRVLIGAATSLADMGTDLFVILTFKNDKNFGYFYALLSSIILSIVIQLFLVYIQNRKMGATR